jgi:hypothetical protein
MKKVFNFIFNSITKALYFLKDCFLAVINFVKLDGLLHFLACAFIIFTFAPIVDSVGNAVIIATVVALSKEYVDLLMLRTNTWKQSLKDVLFDALGVGYAVLFLCFIY